VAKPGAACTRVPTAVPVALEAALTAPLRLDQLL